MRPPRSIDRRGGDPAPYMSGQLNGQSKRLRTVRQGFDSLTGYHLIFIKKYDIIYIQNKGSCSKITFQVLQSIGYDIFLPRKKDGFDSHQNYENQLPCLCERQFTVCRDSTIGQYKRLIIARHVFESRSWYHKMRLMVRVGSSPTNRFEQGIHLRNLYRVSQ